MSDNLNNDLNNELEMANQPVNDGGIVVRPAAPQGTGFNRKTVMIITVSIGAFLMLGIMYAFTPPVKPASTEQIGQQQAGQTSAPAFGLAPDELNDLPDGYERQVVTKDSPEMLPPLDGFDEALFSQPKVPKREGFIDDRYDFGSEGEYRTGSSEMTLEQKELLAAKKSPIRFNSGSNEESMKKDDSGKKESSAEESSIDALAKAMMQQMNADEGYPDEVGQQSQTDHQDQKRDFIKQNHGSAFYATSSLQKPLSRYEVKAGTIIPAVLITGINSDLPGKLVAQVRENVYDTVTGRYLLIPQGSRIIGTYDSKVIYGQKRVLVVWNRLIYPNGDSIDLQTLIGVDGSGYSGVKDRVNNHYGRLISGIFFTSVFSAGARVAQGEASERMTYSELATQGASENVSRVGVRLAEKNMNIQPTLEIRPGFRFNVLVDKDFILQPYKVKR